MMKNFTVILLLVLAPLLANTPHKCGFYEAVMDYHSGIRADRPETDTYAVTPSGDFWVHYDLTGIDAPDQTDADSNGVPDYIDAVGIMADSIRHVLVDVMGFDPVPPDTDGIYDIYVGNRGPGAYGLTTLDGANGASFLEIDNDFEEGYYVPGINTMRLTVAHEYFHAVQLGYTTNISFNRFFYEMTSTWIEDVVVPDGDDYIYWVNNFFVDPTQNIYDTDGYSIALFGHFLSRIVDGHTNETESTIIRQMWEDFGGTNHNAITAMQTVLEDDFDSTFQESWLEFICSLMFNGEDPNFFFYEDQALIFPPTTYISPLIGSETFILDASETSVDIESWRLFSQDAGLGILDVAHDPNDFLGRIVVVSSETSRNAIYNPDPEFLTDGILVNDEIHFIYANPSVEITAAPQFSPLPPTGLIGLPSNGEIQIIWNPSLGPGDFIHYLIYRDDENIGFTYDTTFVDTDIQGSTTYEYWLYAVSEVGQSAASESIFVTSWPESDDVLKNRIVSVFPNPMNLNHFSSFGLVVDSKADYGNPSLELYNLLGEQVWKMNLPAISQGRQIVYAPHLDVVNISSGLYLYRFNYNKKISHTGKFSILH